MYITYVQSTSTELPPAESAKVRNVEWRFQADRQTGIVEVRSSQCLCVCARACVGVGVVFDNLDCNQFSLPKKAAKRTRRRGRGALSTEECT